MARPIVIHADWDADASVWVAGGNPTRGSYNQTMEIYKPAYLFNSDGSPASPRAAMFAFTPSA